MLIFMKTFLLLMFSPLSFHPWRIHAETVCCKIEHHPSCQSWLHSTGLADLPTTSPVFWEKVI